MLSDPQTITVGGGAKTFGRRGSTAPARLGVFQTDDGLYVLEVRQDVSTKSKRQRHESRLTLKKVAADPLTAVNTEVSSSIIVTIDESAVGFTQAELIDALTGLVTWLSASTYANAKLVEAGHL